MGTKKKGKTKITYKCKRGGKKEKEGGERK